MSRAWGSQSQLVLNISLYRRPHNGEKQLLCWCVREQISLKVLAGCTGPDAAWSHSRRRVLLSIILACHTACHAGSNLSKSRTHFSWTWCTAASEHGDCNPTARLCFEFTDKYRQITLIWTQRHHVDQCAPKFQTSATKDRPLLA